MTGNWRDRFEPQRPIGSATSAPPMQPEPARAELAHDDGPDLDLSVYRPWTLQRGRSRPSMMIDFRRYDARSGMWSGWALSYPHLVGIQYTGARLLSLNFGARSVMVEGNGLDELVRHIQQGTVTAVQQFASEIWGAAPRSAVVTVIRDLENGM